MRYNKENYEPGIPTGRGFELRPPGEYEFEIIDVELKRNRKGFPMIIIFCQDLSGHSQYPIRYYFSEKENTEQDQNAEDRFDKTFGAILDSIGKDPKGSDAETLEDLSMLLPGKTFTGKTIHEKYPKDDTGKMHERIRYFQPKFSKLNLADKTIETGSEPREDGEIPF